MSKLGVSVPCHIAEESRRAPIHLPSAAPSSHRFLTCVGMLTVRLRTRDGTERIQVAADGNVAHLREAVSNQVERPVTQFVLSTDQSLVRCWQCPCHVGKVV
jgi:Nuclear pore localisation protein NPL4